MLSTSSQMDAPRSPTSVASSQNIVIAAKGSGITFAGKLFEYTGRFALGILLARFMGAEQYGLYSLADTALSVLTGIALLGLGDGVVRYVSMFVSHRDEKALWGTLQIGLGIPVTIGILMSICLFVFANPFANLVFHEPKLVLLLQIVAFAIPLNVLMFIAAAATRGFKQMHYAVIAQDISLTLIKLILVILLAVVGLTAVGAITAYTIGLAVASMLLLYFLHQLFSLKRPPKAAQFNVKQLLSFSLPVYASKLIDMFGGNIQTLLLGAMHTITSVGVFTAASRISIMGKMFHGSIVTTTMPIVSELYSKRDWKQLTHFYQTVTKWTFSFNLPLFLIVLLFSRPILSLFGESFAVGSLALILLSAGNLVDAGTGICGVVINMTGHTWLNTFNSILALTSTLILNLLLIPTMGVTGAAVAAAIATIVLNLTRLSEVFILFRVLPYNRSFIKPILASLTATAATWLIVHQLFGKIDLVYAVLGMVFLLTIYVAMIVLLGLSQEDQMILRRLYDRLSRKMAPKREI